MYFFKRFFSLFEQVEKDEEYYSKYVRRSQFRIEYVSEELLDNESFAFAAVKYDNNLFKYVSERLRNNKELAEITVKSSFLLLNYVSEKLRDDEDVVLIAIKNHFSNDYTFNGACAGSFLHASRRLRNDENFIKRAVSVNGRVLDHIRPKFKDNKEVMVAAGINDIWAFKRYASRRLLNDEDTFLAICKYDSEILKYTPRRFRKNKEFILKAVSSNGSAIYYSLGGLRDDRDVALTAVKQDGCAIDDLSSIFQNDREICIAAIRQNPDAYKYTAAIRWDELESIKNDINYK